MTMFSDEPTPANFYQVVDTRDCVRYMDVSEAPWFMDRIRWAFGSTEPNLRMDRADGTTILWLGYYRLPLGYWLYAGVEPLPDFRLRESLIRPVLEQWPWEVGNQSPAAGAGEATPDTGTGA